MGAINEILPKATGVGKIDSTSDGTGEIFNSYEGYHVNVASGSASHAEGGYTRAVGDYSHAEGGYTRAEGAYSHAEGCHTRAEGDYSHAEGSGTTASGTSSHAEGSGTTASGDYSHAEGSNTTASGRYSHSEGCNTTAIGSASHVEGYNTSAFGSYSHAEGDNTTASGNNSHSEGYRSNASGAYAHAEGGYTRAVGDYSHTEGASTYASGNYSHAEGASTNALSYCEHAEGIYNKSYDSEDVSVRVIHSVGIGSSDDDRKNAHEIKFNGDHYVYGLGNFDGTNSDSAQTLQEVINSKQNVTDAVGKIDPNSDGTGEIFNNYEGNNANVASGRCSHAEGYSTNATSHYSHAEGYSTNALNLYEHAEGRSNVSNTGDTEDLQTRHSVGIGTSSSDHKNAHEIMANGDHYIYGIGGYDGKNATANTSSTLQQIINSMFNITVDLSGYDTVMANNGAGFKIADLSDQHYINGADIFIKDDDIEGAIKYFVVKKNENMAETINFSNGTTFEYTQEYGLKRNGDESVKVYARYGKYSTEEKSKWWLMKITPAGGGSN